MDTIPGYCILSTIYEDSSTIITKALSGKNETPVILKYPQRGLVGAEVYSRYQHEYKILQSISASGVISPIELYSLNRSPVLILEDIGGDTLEAQFEKKPPGLKTFLRVALKIIAALAAIHKQKITHNDLSPCNIILSSDSRELQIVGFSLASQSKAVVQNQISPDLLQRNLFCISPEQTGRMNISVDYRTDFYSLGVTFYWMLAGQYPFTSADPQEIIHSHLAESPADISKINPDISPVIIAMITKLMAKNPEDRYQSCRAIEADLQRCLVQLKQPGDIPMFTSGTEDKTGVLRLPGRVYGRKKETDSLSASLNRLQYGEKEFVLLTGSAGMGKTTLVNEVYKSAAKRDDYYIVGKFDQFQTDFNSNGIIEAFRNLVHELLTEDESQFKQWKKKINAILGNNIGLILDVIPELELITGSSGKAVEIQDEERKQLFNLVFPKFVSVFCSQKQPLTIFLDDLQWATSNALELVQLIASSDDIQHILVVCAYRDNEIAADHPLVSLLAGLEKTESRLEYIHLSPLDSFAIRNLVGDVVGHSQEISSPLATAIASSSMGNPFFISEFLNAIYQKKLLWCNYEKQIWEWDIEAINGLEVADGVVPLVIERILTLDPKIRDLLKTAACIGSRFESATLAQASDLTHDYTIALLEDSVKNGLILRSKAGGKYAFSHDKVQQAAYAMLGEAEKNRYHYRIGRRLLLAASPEHPDDKIILIVSQLNIGSEYVLSKEDRKELVQLNTVAGKKAQSAFAYEQALTFFSTAVSLFEKWCNEYNREEHSSCWSSDYPFALALYEQTAEAAYLACNYDELWSLLKVASGEVTDPLDESRLVILRIKVLQSQGDLIEAVYEAIDFCGKLGIVLPRKPNKFHIVSAYLRTRILLFGKSTTDFEQLPEMKNPEIFAAYNALSVATMAAYTALPSLIPLIVFIGIKLSLKYGNCHNSIFGYAGYGLFLSNIIGDYDNGRKYGDLALNLMEKMHAGAMKARTASTVYGFIMHWGVHHKEMLSPLKEGFVNGLNVGDYHYGSSSASLFCLNYFLIGTPLSEVEEELFHIKKQIKQLRQNNEYNGIDILGNIVAVLRQENSAFDWVPESMPGDENNKLLLFRKNFYGMILSFLFNQPEQALLYAETSYKYNPAVGNVLSSDPNLNFYHSLSLLALADGKSRFSKRRIVKKVKSLQKKMKKWAGVGPMNHEHKYNLVKAELFKVLGRFEKAELCYKRAIEGANTNNYVNEEAIANELMAAFYLANNKLQEAKVSMIRAHHCYYQWGATAKIHDLEIRYPYLLQRCFTAIDDSAEKPIFHSPDRRHTVGHLNDFDWLSVLKSSQALSGEINMDKLLEKMMRLVLENSGAGYGCLILISNNGPVIRSEMSLNRDDFQILQDTAVTESNNIPLSIINYVLRTTKPVLCDNVSIDEKYESDPYIRSCSPKSVLSLPVMLKSDIFGLLYLENRLTTAAFTEQHLEILTMLSSQIAVSLDNARLFAENKERAREQIEQEKKVNREKEHVIQDLHDGIGGSLVHIKTLSEMMLGTTDDPAMQKKAALVAELSAESLTELRGLFRSLDPSRSDWQSLISDISYFGSRVLDGHDIEFRVETEINDSPGLPDGLFSLVLFNICREAMNNITKYSQATSVSMKIRLNADEMVLIIHDDGIGFIGKPETGRGLGIMQKRAKEIGASITITGDEGVKIVLTLPLM